MAMTDLNQTTNRRSILRHLGIFGAALPVTALLGCTDTKAPATATGTAASKATAAAAAAEQKPVDLAYLPNPAVGAPVKRTTSEVVKVALETTELDGKLADGAGYHYWTFNGTVPGPMIRVREGDTVELSLTNKAGNSVGHNIDLHAVLGPGGGASLTNVSPGQTKTFRFKALHPGVYIYHCATPPIPMHISAGMYGLIVVEPAAGLAPVDREFYICQGEIYTTGKAGDPGLQSADLTRMSMEQPSYVVFNGAVGSITGDRALKANVGEKIRIFFGVGGPNLISSFHIIGTVFDRVATWGSFTSMAEHVQTVSVSPGGATMVELTLPVPGTFLIVDHSLSRLEKGAAGQIVVSGAAQPDIFSQVG
jgi:nitrite reductase (NO-forming)